MIGLNNNLIIKIIIIRGVRTFRRVRRAAGAAAWWAIRWAAAATWRAADAWGAITVRIWAIRDSWAVNSVSDGAIISLTCKDDAREGRGVSIVSITSIMKLGSDTISGDPGRNTSAGDNGRWWPPGFCCVAGWVNCGAWDWKNAAAAWVWASAITWAWDWNIAGHWACGAAHVRGSGWDRACDITWAWSAAGDSAAWVRSGCAWDRAAHIGSSAVWLSGTRVRWGATVILGRKADQAEEGKAESEGSHVFNLGLKITSFDLLNKIFFIKWNKILLILGIFFLNKRMC